LQQQQQEQGEEQRKSKDVVEEVVDARKARVRAARNKFIHC
jgi:hypothetical protein